MMNFFVDLLSGQIPSQLIQCLITFYISGQDSCNGDSGGPIVYRRYTDDPWYQAGIASFGYGHECGTDTPGIYTRIGELIIKRHI